MINLTKIQNFVKSHGKKTENQKSKTRKNGRTDQKLEIMQNQNNFSKYWKRQQKFKFLRKANQKFKILGHYSWFDEALISLSTSKTKPEQEQEKYKFETQNGFRIQNMEK